MKSLILYDKKENKINNNNQFEADLDDLESLGIFKHGKEFLEIPERKIDGKTIVEWFALNDISLWWFAAPIIHPKFKDSMLFIDRLSALLNEHSFNVLKLKGCFDKLEIIQELCTKKNLKLELSKHEYFTFSKKQKIKNILKENTYRQIHKRKTKKRLNTFSKFAKYQKPSPGYVLITSPDLYRRKSFNPLYNKTLSKEYFIQPFIDFCSKNRISSLCVDLDYTFRGTTEILKDRLQSKENWIPVEYISQNYQSKFNQKSLKSLEKSIKELGQKDLSKIFSYKEISLWSMIKPILNDVFLEPHFPTYLNLLENVEKFLKETQPSVIIQTYEAGPYAKVFELAASKLNIKTIGLQHGLILSDIPDYFFNQIRTKQNLFGNIIPDITLVFGEYYKKLLIEKSAYSENNVKVFGHPEYFDIEEIKSKLSKQELRTKFNLPNKTIILVSLSFRFSYISNSPDRVLLKFLYEELKDNDNLIILIRPHPGDKLNELILKKNYPAKNFLLSKGSLIEDFIASDIVVVLPLGTVSTEAIMFDKPIIFPDIIQKNKLDIDSVFKILIENKLALMANKSNFKQTVDSITSNQSTNSNSLEKEKIIKYLSNLKCDPLIENYITKLKS